MLAVIGSPPHTCAYGAHRLRRAATVCQHAIRYLPKGGEVLDLGTGNGRNAKFFATHGFAVTALDSDEATIAALRRVCAHEQLSMRLVQADVRSWRSDRSYAAILCTMVLHFLSSEEEVAAVLGEMRAATKKGGINVVSIYTSRNRLGTDLF